MGLGCSTGEASGLPPSPSLVGVCPPSSWGGAALAGAPRSVSGGREWACGLCRGGLCPPYPPVPPGQGLHPGPLCFLLGLSPQSFLYHHLQLSPLDPASSPLGLAWSPAAEQSALCGCSIPLEECRGVCPRKRLSKACFSSPGLRAHKAMGVLPRSPLLLTWPPVRALPWYPSSLEEPLLSNFLPPSLAPELVQQANKFWLALSNGRWIPGSEVLVFRRGRS